MAVAMNPDSGVEQRPLPLEIHAATRSSHTALNRLITSRLPLCLPPHAANPLAYAEGMATFGEIYFLFEQVWDEIPTSGLGNPRVYEALKQLKVPALSRSANLKADLSILSQRFDGSHNSYTARHGELTQSIKCTRQSIVERPHLIMSYAWIMYMALFNGGRWIRDQLTQVGPDFWGAQKHTRSPSIDCLSFWDFEGELDGDDIKNNFKARFNIAASMLNDTEQQEVICEAVKIFETCSQMVGWLDKQTGLSSPESIAAPESQSWLAASFAAASSTVCAIWSGLTRAMPSASLQQSELQLPANHHAS